jgi:hypothetical protein
LACEKIWETSLATNNKICIIAFFLSFSRSQRRLCVCERILLLQGAFEKNNIPKNKKLNKVCCEKSKNEGTLKTKKKKNIGGGNPCWIVT